MFSDKFSANWGGGRQMNNMAHMRNCPEGCMVDEIRSPGNCNFYLPLFSLIHDLDLIKKRLIKTVSDALT